MTVSNADPRLKDKQWRVGNLYKIQTKKATFEKFKRNAAQEDYNTQKHSRNIILKSRQLGFTTDEAIDTLDDMAFNRNFNALFIAQGLEPARDIFDNKIKLAWDNFRLKQFYTSVSDNARKLKVGFGENEKGEEVFSSITVATSGRSGTFQRVHVTEFAKLCKEFPNKALEVVRGTFPAVPTHGRIDIESTAEDSQGLFYNMFWEAWDRGEPTLPTQFKAHFYNWQWDPEITETPIIDVPDDFKTYQELYKLTDQEISYYYLKFTGLGEGDRNWSTMKREFPTTPEEAFEGSGSKLFDAEKLGQMPILKPIKEYGGWRIYKEYKLGHNYAIAADVAEGVGQDASTIVIIDFTPAVPEVVAVYKNNMIAPDLFAYEIANIAEKYENPLVAVECNNHGHTTLSKLKEIYPDRHIFKYDNSGTKPRYGWKTDLISKPRMFFDLNTAVNEDLVMLNDKGLISEARRYDREDMRIVRFQDDENTAHFDVLVGCCICFQMRDHIGFYKRRGSKPSQRKGSGARRGTGMRGT